MTKITFNDEAIKKLSKVKITAKSITYTKVFKVLIGKIYIKFLC